MIYCIEDDTSTRELMLYALNSSGFEAKGFKNGKDFWGALEAEKPDLIMLDIMLPEEDGIEILKKLRADQETENIPVIMATAKGTEFDKVLGLDSGADDYLVKPFGMMEMVAHIKAVLRRTMPKEKNSILQVGELSVNTAEHTVSACGKRIELTLKEYELLRLFSENIGRAFTRDELLSRVWGVDYIGETRTVDVHIGTLRTKLDKCGDYIQTVRGVGYRMEAVK